MATFGFHGGKVLKHGDIHGLVKEMDASVAHGELGAASMLAGEGKIVQR